MNLTAVNDPVFSSEMMGKGLAIMPTANKVYAPADGLLNLVAETGHAYGIQTDAGAEVLIHIGIDTVTLGQEVFQTQVTQGHRVKKGDLLGTFDRKAIKEAGLDSTVMVIITNTSSYLSVEPMMSNHNEITPEQIILNLNTPN